VKMQNTGNGSDKIINSKNEFCEGQNEETAYEISEGHHINGSYL